MKPLSGLQVVSLKQDAAAPYCSLRLADAGVHVIKSKICHKFCQLEAFG